MRCNIGLQGFGNHLEGVETVDRRRQMAPLGARVVAEGNRRLLASMANKPRQFSRHGCLVLPSVQPDPWYDYAAMSNREREKVTYGPVRGKVYRFQLL